MRDVPCPRGRFRTGIRIERERVRRQRHRPCARCAPVASISGGVAGVTLAVFESARAAGGIVGRDAGTRLPPTVNIVDHRGAETALFVPPRTPDPPSIPGHVPVAVTPGPAPAVIVIAGPGIIVPARPINHRAVILVSAGVT